MSTSWKDLATGQTCAVDSGLLTGTYTDCLSVNGIAYRVGLCVLQGDQRNNHNVITKPFDIKLGKTKLTLSGMTGLDQTIDYSVAVALPQITLHGKIGGTFSKPKVALDSAKMVDQALSKAGVDREEVAEKVEDTKAKAIAEAEQKAAQLIETARAEADKLVEKATNPIAKIAAKAAADKLISEAENQAAKLINEAKNK